MFRPIVAAMGRLLRPGPSKSKGCHRCCAFFALPLMVTFLATWVARGQNLVVNGGFDGGAWNS